MVLNPTISLREMIDILRSSLEVQLGMEVDEIYVSSYDKNVIVIDGTDKVTAVDFSHRAGKG